MVSSRLFRIAAPFRALRKRQDRRRRSVQQYILCRTRRRGERAQ